MRERIVRQGVRADAGILSRFVLGTSSSSSDLLIHGCSPGTFLNTTSHATVHRMLATPNTTNDARHPERVVIASTRGGVIAPPSRAKLCVMPWAKPRSPAGIQKVSARVAV